METIKIMFVSPCTRRVIMKRTTYDNSRCNRHGDDQNANNQLLSVFVMSEQQSKRHTSIPTYELEVGSNKKPWHTLACNHGCRQNYNQLRLQADIASTSSMFASIAFFRPSFILNSLLRVSARS